MSSKEFGAKTFVWLRQINTDKALRPSDAKIAIALTRFFTEEDQDGRAYPSCLTLARDAQIEESTVVRGVRRLEAQGHLTVVWGQRGSGHSSQYWMSLKPAAEHVSEANKPARRAARKPARWSGETCQAAGDSTINPGGAHAPPFMERENALRAVAPKSCARPSAGAAPDKGERKGRREGGRPTATVKPRKAEGDYLALRAAWARPWVDDDGGQAWLSYDEAVREVAPRVILSAARAWVEAADAPRFLPSLGKWLSNRGWERPPPQRGKPRPDKAAHAPRHGRKASLAQSALEINAGGW
jgi:hypothetical protein